MSGKLRILKGNKVVLIALAFVLIAGAWYAPKRNLAHGPEGHNSHNHMEECAIAEASDDCYMEAYAGITREHGVSSAFEQLKSDYISDARIRSDCHQIVHVIGRTAGDMYGSVSEAYGHGDEFCWSGYYHGVMESVLADIPRGDIAQNINDVCEDISEDKKYSFYHYNCVHGLGHGTMLVEGHDVILALKLCDNLSDSWERSSCWGGVFMENVIASSNKHHATEYLRDDDPLYPCNAVEDLYKNECFKMQTSRALDVLGGDFKAVFELCETVGNYRTTCFQSLGRDASGRSVSDLAQTKATCKLGQNYEAVSNCVAGAVKDFVSFYHDDQKAKELCAAFEENGISKLCLETASSYYANFN